MYYMCQSKVYPESKLHIKNMRSLVLKRYFKTESWSVDYIRGLYNKMNVYIFSETYNKSFQWYNKSFQWYLYVFVFLKRETMHGSKKKKFGFGFLLLSNYTSPTSLSVRSSYCITLVWYYLSFYAIKG